MLAVFTNAFRQLRGTSRGHSECRVRGQNERNSQRTSVVRYHSLATIERTSRHGVPTATRLETQGMTALGHSRRFERTQDMSASPPIAEVHAGTSYICANTDREQMRQHFVRPISDIAAFTATSRSTQSFAPRAWRSDLVSGRGCGGAHWQGLGCGL